MGINKPWSPLPSGAIDPVTAVYVAISLCILGVSTGFIAGSINGITCIGRRSIIILVLKVLGGAWASREPLAGLSALVVVLWWDPVEESYGIAFPVLYTLLIILGREIIRGVEDVEGDRLYGIMTVAVRYGIRCAVILDCFACRCRHKLSALAPLWIQCILSHGGCAGR